MRLGAFECDVEFGREVEDCFIAGGIGLVTGRPLSEAECERFTEAYAAELAEEHAEFWMGVAEARADAWKDGSFD
jgi:hypothetical protein